MKSQKRKEGLVETNLKIKRKGENIKMRDCWQNAEDKDVETVRAN